MAQTVVSFVAHRRFWSVTSNRDGVENAPGHQPGAYGPPGPA